MGTIPKDIIVGFNEREGTYSKRLAFVTHYMTKKRDNLRYDTNFHKWRDKEIDLEEYMNEPTEGFVIHDRSGGNRCWSKREKKMRVWDPRGWEFELGMDGIEHIISHSDIIGGQIQGEFVYGWFGIEGIALISTKSNEYAALSIIKDKISTLKTSELVVGKEYLTSTGKTCFYLGYYFHFSLAEFLSPDKEANFKKVKLFVETTKANNGNIIYTARNSYKIVKETGNTINDKAIESILKKINNNYGGEYIPFCESPKKYLASKLIADSEEQGTSIYLKDKTYPLSKSYSSQIKDHSLERNYAKNLPYYSYYGFIHDDKLIYAVRDGYDQGDTFYAHSNGRHWNYQSVFPVIFRILNMSTLEDEGLFEDQSIIENAFNEIDNDSKAYKYDIK